MSVVKKPANGSGCPGFPYITQVFSRGLKRLFRVLLGYRCSEVLNSYYSFCQTQRERIRIRRRDLSVMLRNMAASAPTSVPPHSVEVYRSMLNTFSLRPHELAVMPLRDLLTGNKREDVANIYLRHDIDFAPAGLEVLCSVEAEFGFVSSIYVLAAQEDFFRSPYDVAESRTLFEEIRSRGFEIGLHTVAYAAPVEKTLDCFSREIDRFEAALGYLPETFTFHGWPECGNNRGAKRALFADKLLERRDSFNSFMGRMSDYFLNPVTGISDSGVPWPKTARETQHFYPGQIVCVLNHPYYWNRERFLR